MKKIFVSIAALVTSTLAIAQTMPSFGIRAGLSSAHIQGDAVSSLNKLIDYTNGTLSTTNRTGFFAGMYTAFTLSRGLTLEPALQYTQKGYAIKGDLALKTVDFLSATAQARLNAHYIDIPVLLKATVAGFQVFAGPQVSYLAHADLKTRAGVLGINLLNKSLDATKQFNRWDAGITGGIGYQFINGVHVLAAYDHGLSKVDAGKNTAAYNRSFKLGVGMSF